MLNDQASNKPEIVATITNNSKYPLEVCDVFSYKDKNGGYPTYTSLGNLEAGEKKEFSMLHFASRLQACYTGTVPDFQAAQTAMPIKVMVVIASSASFEVNDDDMTAAVQAVKFVKYVGANPTSKIFSGFNAALQSSKKPKEIIAAVDAFFAGQVNFSKCTYATWDAIMGWQMQQFSPWQGVYYLYKAGKDEQASTKIIAVVSIKPNGTAVFQVPDDDGNIVAGSQTVPLAMIGDGTIAEQDIGGGITLSLHPLWINTSTTSKDADDKRVVTFFIGSVLSGTFNEGAVLGLLEKRPVPKPKGQNSAPSSSVSSFQRWTTLASLLVGVVSALCFLKQTLGGHAQAANTAAADAARAQSPAEKQQVADEAAQAESTNTVESAQAELQARTSTSQMSEIADATTSLRRAERYEGLEEVVTEQWENLSAAVEYGGASDQVDAAFQQLDATANKLADPSLAENLTDADIAAFTQDLQETGSSIKQSIAELDSSAYPDDAALLNNVEGQITEATQEAQERESRQTSQEEAMENEGTEPIEENFEPPMEMAID